MVQDQGAVRGSGRGAWVVGMIALLAGAAALAVAMGSVSPVALEDDVTHDSEINQMFNAPSKVRATAAQGQNLRSSSSIQDFFHAAMRGDFEHGNAAQLATNGLFDNKVSKDASLVVSHPKGAKQQLAEGKLQMKAAHLALAKQVHNERRAMPERVEQGRGRHVSHFEKAQEAIRAKFPTEDKFVARYTGPIPSGDVLVDRFSAGPYVPI
mmetsp:Transcript_25558/g.51970  ORF Transcript_25558/g.51970 Transcript_25558/m.51970 type:complete len:210 (+) Transcript_25558:100-729(+)|eukprot:CAMPEP_0181308516 /NCGR_PEP_ID=MMETSP1101-20121128/11510_1 /TAXON_ID=46948 /ORGANISM="Rhodomonas abbreviata, Strain Caron Lab Isolate" /LENGTH=209 /DNA_ID=CAMNT_0023414915 /DNA_START=92 /DNA_END=721 /DNA_ORIENTATION=-